MSRIQTDHLMLPPEQQAIRDKCFHPAGAFAEFPIADVETSIPACFERIATNCSDRVAVQDSEEKWTYAQLNHLSNQLARRIRARVGLQKQPVALVLGDRLLTVAAMLAVLKSANFYVVLDVSYPVDRLAYMLEDSTAKVVLTERKHREIVNALGIGGIETIEVDTIGLEVSGENLNLVLSPLDYAAIVYTSGSAGYPKGVIHNHRNLLFSVFAETNDLHIGHDDRVGVVYSFSSSASTKYAYAALLNGAVLVTFDVSRWGVDRLTSWLIRERVTLCDFPVSLFRTLAYTLQNAGNFPALRVVILGSEAATAEDVSLYKRLFHPKSILVVLFATSETAAIRRYFIEPHGVVPAGAVPVGYAVEGKSVLLVDEAGGDLGIGRNGQIAVRSRYLAVGYWRQPELTRAMFLSAACDGGDERTYLTGDMGRLDDQGCLFHLGRKDHQVNIRGYTIETLEIEHRLLKHPAVKAAAVVGRVSDAGEPILVGYYVASSDAVPKADALGRFLHESLPSHMVPAKLVMLDALPLTPNGKIDRRMLPDPGRHRPALETAYVGPETEIETRLVEIWSAVLSLDAIGIHDNFFDLGGHSLAASRVISRVSQTFKLDMPLKALLDAPTIAQMAKVIAHAGDQIARPELDRLLSEIEAMPEDEARKQVREKNLTGKT